MMGELDLSRAERLVNDHLVGLEESLRPLAQEALIGFYEKFGYIPHAFGKGNGRIEVIGNMTDVRPGGVAIGAPIENAVMAAIGLNDTGIIKVFSQNYEPDGVVELNLNDLQTTSPAKWVPYIQAILGHMNHLDVEKLQGCDIYLQSNVPTVGGVSSSAALEMAVGLGLMQAYKVDRSRFDDRYIAQVLRKAEHKTGSMCGLLDQGCSVAKGGVLLTFAAQADGFEYLAEPVDLNAMEQAEYQFMIVAANLPRKLGETGYPHKKALVNQAADLLARLSGHGDITPVDLFSADNQSTIQKQVGGEAYNALLHWLEENQRVLQTAKYLNEKSISDVLALITASGRSSLDHYGVADAVPDKGVLAVPQLPVLVQIAGNLINGGVHAVRTHGGGWNGTILLVVKDGQQDFIKNTLTTNYHQNGFSEDLSFIDVKIGRGSQAWQLPTTV